MLTLLVLAGCGPNVVQQLQEVPLIDATLWTVSGEAEDPFDDRPESVECSSLGYAAESTYFEVDTTFCEYATFVQPTLVDIAEGDLMTLVAWHLDLWAAEPAEAHMVVQVGDQVLYEEWIPIPSDSNIFEKEGTAEDVLPSGTPVYFHVHNHGYNNWAVSEIMVETLVEVEL